MIVLPRLSENLSFFIELPRQIITQVSQILLKFFLECVQDAMDVTHCLNCLFFVLLDLTVDIIMSDCYKKQGIGCGVGTYV